MPYEGKARSAMFSRRQSGGVFVIDDAMRHPGNVFFVDSGQTTTGGDTVGHGRNPDAPFLTIDYAVGQCVASNGDVIYVLPGHAEVVSAAAGLALDVIGISVIGCGNGSLQPTITFDTDADADMDVDAAGILVENIHFVANFADIVAMIDVNADDFTLRDCRFSQAAVDMNALITVQDALANASDRITIEGCHAIMYDASNTHFVNFAGTGTGHIIRDNILMGDWGTMCIGGAGLTTYTTIIDNVIYNAAADNDSCINSAATSGLCMRNLAGGGAAQANGFTAAGLALAENYYAVAAEDLSALLEPVVT